MVNGTESADEQVALAWPAALGPDITWHKWESSIELQESLRDNQPTRF